MAGQPVDVKLFGKWSFEDIEVRKALFSVKVKHTARSSSVCALRLRSSVHHRGGCFLLLCYCQRQQA